MPAAFPDSWQFSARPGGGLQASIVIPAAGATVRHVLTNVHAKMHCLGGGAGAFVPVIEILDGATLLTNALALVVDGAAISSDSGDISGPFMGSPATAMTIRYNAASPANIGEALFVEGYDA